MKKLTPQKEENLKYFNSNLLRLMELHNTKQVDLVNTLNIPKTTINGYVKGNSLANPGNVQLLADYFGVLKSELDLRFKDDLNDETIADITSIYSQLHRHRQTKVYNFAEQQLTEQNESETSSIYLVGQTAAGTGLVYGDIMYDQIDTNVPKGADKALVVKGDSMEPLIENGSIIFYKEQPNVENGEIAIVELNGGEVTCKKFYYNGENVILKSINKKYDDMVLDDSVRVIGKVIM